MFWLPTFSCWLKQIFEKLFIASFSLCRSTRRRAWTTCCRPTTARWSDRRSAARTSTSRSPSWEGTPSSAPRRSPLDLRASTSAGWLTLTNAMKHQTVKDLMNIQWGVWTDVWLSAVFFLVFQINRSDSDSSTLSKKSPFVRNASERRSMRMKKVKRHFCLLILLSGSLNHVVIWLSISDLMRCATKAPCPGQSTFNVQSTVAFRVWGLHLNAPWWMNLWR